MGGVAFVLESMGEQFDSLLDVTIFYPDGAKPIWCLFSGQVNEVVVRVERHPIPPEIVGNRYQESSENRKMLRNWINDIWERKDQLLELLRSERQGHNPSARSAGK
jgi:hypothetical protein